MSTHNSKSVDDIARDLLFSRMRLAEHLRDKYGNNSAVNVNVISQTSYPYSVICLVEALISETIIGRYYIKRLLTRAAGRTGAEKQCIEEERLLRRLNNSMPSETVELILVIPERLTIITAECAGTKFGSMFHRYPVRCRLKSYQQMLSYYSACCGDWLRRFHLITQTENEGFLGWIDFQCGEIEWRVKELSIHNPKNKSTYDEVAHKLEQDFKRLPTPAFTSMIHRDFAPHNIFLDSNHIQVLDFSDVQDGHGLMDVINYISSLATRCEHKLVSSSLIRTMCLLFIEAYGGISDDDVDIFNSLVVLQSLKRLLVIYKRQSDFPWADALQSGKNWHYKFLSKYITDNYIGSKTLKSPWPFLDLN